VGISSQDHSQPGSRLVGRRTPLRSGYAMTELERALLDALAEIIAQDILRRREQATKQETG
jgi:DNA-binding HxlR family transcriptional regulator